MRSLRWAFVGWRYTDDRYRCALCSNTDARYRNNDDNITIKYPRVKLCSAANQHCRSSLSDRLPPILYLVTSGRHTLPYIHGRPAASAQLVAVRTCRLFNIYYTTFPIKACQSIYSPRHCNIGGQRRLYSETASLYSVLSQAGGAIECLNGHPRIE